MEQTPSDFERELIKQVKEGKKADFSEHKSPTGQRIKPPLSAVLLRRLILGIPVPLAYSNGAELKPIETPCGVRIKGAVIEGTLDLADGGRDGGGDCPALVLEDCHLPGDPYGETKGVGIDARHVRLARLEVKNCRFHKLDLSGAELSGDFDFSCAEPLNTESECLVIARDARIDGTVRAAKAKLRLIHGQEKSDPRSDYALDLRGAEILGNVMLCPGFVADEGVGLANCIVSGDLRLEGAHLKSSKGDALFAQMSKIDGGVLLRATLVTEDMQEKIKVFRADGRVDFYQASLGMLDLSGAVLNPATGDTNREAPVLNAPLANIRGHLFMNSKNGVRFTANGTLLLSNAIIGGVLSIFDAKVRAINASSIKVGGSVVFFGDLLGAADFSGARIEDSMSLGWSDKHGSGATYPLHVFAEKTKKVSIGPTKPKAQVIFENAVIGQVKVAGIEGRNFTPFTDKTAQKVRVRLLACYPTKKLGEALYKSDKENEDAVIISFMVNVKDDSFDRVLSGDSSRIHELNGQGTLVIDTSDQAKEYLRFFCANVWGEEGAFIIVEHADVTNLSGSLKGQIPELTVEGPADDKSWKVSAGVVYANYLFKAEFRIPEDGKIEMLKDEPLQELRLEPAVLYSKPFRLTRDIRQSPKDVFIWPLTVPDAWSEPENAETTVWESCITQKVDGGKPTSKGEQPALIWVNMEGVKAGGLDDNHGRRWGKDVRLQLDGFVYERVGLVPLTNTQQFNASSKESDKEADEQIEQIAGGRISWLMKQYDGPVPTEGEYTPQPFDHLTKILRGAGRYEAADEVTIRKRKLERLVEFSTFYQSTFWSWPNKLVGWIHFSWLDPAMDLVIRLAKLAWDGFFEKFFSYGLSIPRAFLTCSLLTFVGYLGVEIANYGYVRHPLWSSEESPPPAWVPAFLRLTPPEKPVLVVETTPVSTGVVQGQDSTGDGNKLVSIRATEGVEEIPCREAVDSLWYAIDVAVPVLDLNQESKCTISSGSHAWWWRLWKQIYAIMGALITSLTVLTVSGILRRHLSKSD